MAVKPLLGGNVTHHFALSGQFKGDVWALSEVFFSKKLKKTLFTILNIKQSSVATPRILVSASWQVQL